MLWAAAFFILGPGSGLPPPAKVALHYHRIELWVPIAGTEDYEWRCTQEKNQPSFGYMVLSCLHEEVETYGIHGRDTKEFLKLLPK